MKTFVLDTSVLIDLDRGTLIKTTFHLPFNFTVPDALYERELRAHGGANFVRMGLLIQELDGDGVSLALGYLRKRRQLSLPDGLALALAKINAWTLLTGDRILRQRVDAANRRSNFELAKEEEVQCHGVLWLLDQMSDHRVIGREHLCAGLGKIAAHPRCRLPRTEIRKRLISYSAY